MLVSRNTRPLSPARRATHASFYICVYVSAKTLFNCYSRAAIERALNVLMLLHRLAELIELL